MKVYVVRYNVDMNEGRGPMAVKYIFANRDQAEAYIDAQTGIQGRKAKWSQYTSGGDWQITEYTLIESCDEARNLDKAELKAQALRKLTEKERWALGYL